jgi:hypothetical protein
VAAVDAYRDGYEDAAHQQVAAYCRQVLDIDPAGTGHGLDAGGPTPAWGCAMSHPQRSGSKLPKLRAGQLREQVFTALLADPTRSWSVTELADHLGGRSAGAVGQALEKLAAGGLAHLVASGPRRYRATPTSPSRPGADPSTSGAGPAAPTGSSGGGGGGQPSTGQATTMPPGAAGLNGGRARSLEPPGTTRLRTQANTARCRRKRR